MKKYIGLWIEEEDYTKLKIIGYGAVSQIVRKKIHDMCSSLSIDTQKIIEEQEKLRKEFEQ